MRSGTIALLLGIMSVHATAVLPDAAFVQYLPLALLIAWTSRRLRLPALFVAGALWCLLRAHLAIGEILPPGLEGIDLVAEGRIVDLPRVENGRTRFLLDIQQVDLPGGESTAGAGSAAGETVGFSGRARLSWYGAPPIRPGEHWRVVVRLRQPRGFANPGSFDYERWLLVNGIRATGYVRNTSGARRLKPAAAWHIDRWRQALAERITNALAGEPSAGIVTALSVGSRHGVSPEQWSVLRNTGTAHLMAISGLHVGLVAGLVYLLMNRLWAMFALGCLYLPAPRAAAVAALLAGLFYAAMAGFSLPTLRALILLAVVMWCQLRMRSTHFTVALCAALCVILVLDPMSVLGASLWLSFGATAVLAFGMLHRSHGHAAGGLNGVCWRWGRAQVVIALGLAPLLMYSFGQQPLLAPLANLAAVPWTGFLVIPAAISGALGVNLWPEGAAVVLGFASRLIDWLWPLLEWIDGAGMRVRPLGPLPLWALGTATLGALLISLPREVPGRWLGWVLMAPLLAMGAASPKPGSLWLTLLDVGHGLAVVVQTRHHALVFDTGPSYSRRFDAGSQIIAPFLRSRGISRLDTVLLSHTDADHAGGFRGLMGEVSAERIFAEGHETCSAGQSWRWDGYRFSVLHPPPGDDLTGNDSSCVLQIIGPGGSLLLTGDIESRAERALVARFGKRLQSDVLLAPHHGSRSSSTSEFVNRVRPAVVLVSNAYRRHSKFPHPSIRERYRSVGATLLETAKLGAIQVELKGNGQAPAIRGFRETAPRYWRAPG